MHECDAVGISLFKNEFYQLTEFESHRVLVSVYTYLGKVRHRGASTCAGPGLRQLDEQLLTSVTNSQPTLNFALQAL